MLPTRLEALTIPDLPTIVEIDVPGREPHHFKLPVFSDQIRISEATADIPGAAGFVIANTLIAMLGWYHETLELETPEPDEYTVKALRQYARDVQRELEDFGYGPHEIARLVGAVAGKAHERNERSRKEIEEAKKTSDFGEPPQDTETSP